MLFFVCHSGEWDYSKLEKLKIFVSDELTTEAAREAIIEVFTFLDEIGRLF